MPPTTATGHYSFGRQSRICSVRESIEVEILSSLVLGGCHKAKWLGHSGCKRSSISWWMPSCDIGGDITWHNLMLIDSPKNRGVHCITVAAVVGYTCSLTFTIKVPDTQAMLDYSSLILHCLPWKGEQQAKHFAALFSASSCIQILPIQRVDPWYDLQPETGYWVPSDLK